MKFLTSAKNTLLGEIKYDFEEENVMDSRSKYLDLVQLLDQSGLLRVTTQPSQRFHGFLFPAGSDQQRLRRVRHPHEHTETDDRRGQRYDGQRQVRRVRADDVFEQEPGNQEELHQRAQ